MILSLRDRTDATRRLDGLLQQTNQNTSDIQLMLQREHHREARKTAVKVVSAHFAGARSYANLIIMAGYAAFFAVWGSVHDSIGSLLAFLSLLIMILSATVFVFFEVGKMFWVSLVIKRKAKALSASEGLRALQLVDESERKEAVVVGRVWFFVLLVTVLPSLGALGILVFGKVRLLIETPIVAS